VRISLKLIAPLLMMGACGSEPEPVVPHPPVGAQAEEPQSKAATVDVVIRVNVRRDGTPESVAVLNDPGGGFGDAAVRMAMAQKYALTLDDAGAAIPTSVTFRVRFDKASRR
jgi:hypothetical protein